jgi:predicted transcriptional regulator YheO
LVFFVCGQFSGSEQISTLIKSSSLAIGYHRQICINILARNLEVEKLKIIGFLQKFLEATRKFCNSLTMRQVSDKFMGRGDNIYQREHAIFKFMSRLF